MSSDRQDERPAVAGDAQYDAFADDFERHAANSPYNAYYDRPATLGLLGDVQDKDVLDAGCGPGFYSDELVRRGARVIGFDQSMQMVRLARARLGERAVIRHGDLDHALPWLSDSSQDLALMALVIHHVEDRRLALNELHRVLRPDGRLVLSTSHPTTDWMIHGGSYFTEEAIEETWKQRWRVRYWRQPLERWCAEFADAGFLIENVIEPQPLPEMAHHHPDYYARLTQEPGFIAFRLAKAC